MKKTVRVDTEVRAELSRRRFPEETNHDGVIERALRERELEDRLSSVGLSTDDMAELIWLRATRGDALKELGRELENRGEREP